MGLAKVAELNHHPGPKHVLQLAEQLGLTDEQIHQTKKVYDEMKTEAIWLGKLFIEKERNLEQAWTTRSIDETHLRLLLSEIGQLKSDLRFVHLRAHLKMVGILSSEQIDQYDEHRGYHGTKKDHPHQMHQH